MYTHLAVTHQTVAAAAGSGFWRKRRLTECNARVNRNMQTDFSTRPRSRSIGGAWRETESQKTKKEVCRVSPVIKRKIKIDRVRSGRATTEWNVNRKWNAGRAGRGFCCDVFVECAGR